MNIYVSSDVQMNEDKYVQEHGYISLTELQTHVNNIEAKYTINKFKVDNSENFYERKS